jgi:hypothetical protein
MISDKRECDESNEQARNDERLSLVVCLCDDALLQENLLASPCLGSESRHEVIAIRNAPSAGAGLNLGIEQARNQWVICVHQDVLIPHGWDARLGQQLKQAEDRFGRIGVAGVYGVGDVADRAEGPPAGPRPASEPLRPALAAQRIGRVVDRGRMLNDGPVLPAPVVTLDELLLVVRCNTPLRFDPELGFHFYGADLCLQARVRGLAVVALDVPCHHNSRSVGLPDAFFASARVFAGKWAHRLPIATSCVLFDRAGRMYLLGDAVGPDGQAFAHTEDLFTRRLPKVAHR